MLSQQPPSRLKRRAEAPTWGTSVYVSSTFDDLKECRQAVVDALMLGRLKNPVIDVAWQEGSAHAPVEWPSAALDLCEIFVGIYAFRYGYVPPNGRDNPQQLSLTELELRRALALGKRCLVFMVDDDADWPTAYRDDAAGPEQGERMRRFRQWIRSKFVVEAFRSADELAQLVRTAVAREGLQFERTLASGTHNANSGTAVAAPSSGTKRSLDEPNRESGSLSRNETSSEPDPVDKRGRGAKPSDQASASVARKAQAATVNTVEPARLLAQRRPPAFPPPWAVAWGDDRYGLWADLEVRDVVQRMRWIEAGEFWMGSPPEEQDRLNNEGPRHRVRLTDGFWLADTACTQALWLAVMGGQNPASFQDGPDSPVEQVSWDDTQAFLDQLTSNHTAGVSAHLPSEAQWEYACRAGTSTAFAFGSNCSPLQVNYNSRFPYAGAVGAESRSRTVPVKTLPPNSWGLYEVHGNVWEWCADGPRKYRLSAGDAAIADPRGPAESGSMGQRAVRGGSWIYGARRARSACRNASQRGSRHHNLGFRFALASRDPGAI